LKSLYIAYGHKFLSIEPQLGDIQLHTTKGISWIIQGGESGPNKRPFDLTWANHMRYACKELNIPYFFKQIDKIKEIPEELLLCREFPKL
jgi:protein gp37